MDGYVRITVTVITYKQEKIIGRAIDSILQQKEYGLKEVIVCDDCSPDGTWEAIQRYAQKYPEIITAHRNSPNKGIYGNMAQAYSMVNDTDLIIECSGDDIICNGFFKAVQEYIHDNDIHPWTESATIYGDYKIILPNGKEWVVKNDAIQKIPNVKAVDLQLQGKLSPRSSIKTITCFRRFKKIPTDKGVAMAEEFCDIQSPLHSDKNYYIPIVGSAYYAGIGVSTKMGNTKDRTERIEAWKAVMNEVQLESKTIHYLQHKIYRLSYSNKKSLKFFCFMWWHYLRSGRFDIKYLIKELLRMIFTPYNTVVC